MIKNPVDHNVFILGAGFSAAAGAPLIHNFLDRSRQLLDDSSTSLDRTERRHFERVFKFRERVAKSRDKIRMDLDNIEQLFGLVEISDRLGEIKSTVRESAVYLIAKTLQLTTRSRAWKTPNVGFNVAAGLLTKLRVQLLPDLFQNRATADSPFFYADIYDYFTSLVVGMLDDPTNSTTRKATFITFNYDLVLDHALRRLGIAVDYHLKPEPRQRDATVCSVLKLHGSTNWGICTKCRCADSIVLLSEKVTDSPAEFRMLNCTNCGSRSYQPLLIPPSLDKTEYREIMKSVWATAVRELKCATRICIIGYSMPESDTFFKYLLTLGLSQNYRLSNLIVVDKAAPTGPREIGPTENQLEARYNQLLDNVFRQRRFSFIPNGFELFVASQQPRSQLNRGEALGGTIHLY